MSEFDNFREKARAAAVEFDRAATMSGASHDPMAPLFGAMGSMAALQGEMAGLLEQNSAGRLALTLEDRKMVRKELALTVREEVARVARRISLLLAIGAVGSVALAGFGGFIFGMRAATTDLVTLGQVISLPGGAGSAWLDLIRANRDPRDQLEAAEVYPTTLGGRAMRITLWLERPTLLPPAPGGPPTLGRNVPPNAPVISR